MAAAVDVEPHVDAAELGRVETNLEAVVPGLGAGRDFDRDPRDRHRGGSRAGGSGAGIGDAGRRLTIGRVLETAELEEIDRRFAGRRGVAGFALDRGSCGDDPSGAGAAPSRRLAAPAWACSGFRFRPGRVAGQLTCRHRRLGPRRARSPADAVAAGAVAAGAMGAALLRL